GRQAGVRRDFQGGCPGADAAAERGGSERALGARLRPGLSRGRRRGTGAEPTAHPGVAAGLPATGYERRGGVRGAAGERGGAFGVALALNEKRPAEAGPFERALSKVRAT